MQVVPATATAEEVLSYQPAGLFLSNGPGDPAALDYAVSNVKELVDHGLPTFGICLGHQVLGQALGAKTFKLKFGHRGANQPVKDLESGQIEITSQNHGFAVDDNALPNEVQVDQHQPKRSNRRRTKASVQAGLQCAIPPRPPRAHTTRSRCSSVFGTWSLRCDP